MGRIIEKDVEERLIKVYINVGFISYLIEVKKLVSRGSNSSFSVDVSSDDMYKTIINVEFWPNDVFIRDFSFENFFLQGFNCETKNKVLIHYIGTSKYSRHCHIISSILESENT